MYLVEYLSRKLLVSGTGSPSRDSKMLTYKRWIICYALQTLLTIIVRLADVPFVIIRTVEIEIKIA